LRCRRWRLRWQRALGERDRIVEVEGLGQKFPGAAAERAGGAGDVGVGRHHDHRQLRVRGLEPLQQHQAVVAGHAHVGEQQVGRATRAQGVEHGLRRVETVDRVSGLAQRGRQHEAHGAVVVDHPDARAHGTGISWHRLAPHPASAAAG
jgi:hypothetical protein